MGSLVSIVGAGSACPDYINVDVFGRADLAPTRLFISTN